MNLEQVFEIGAYDGFLGDPPDVKYAAHEDERVHSTYRHAYEEGSKIAQYPTYPDVQQGAPQGAPNDELPGGGAVPEGGEPDTPAEENPQDDARTILHSLQQDLDSTEQEMEDAHQARNFEAYERAFKRYDDISKQLEKVRNQISKTNERSDDSSDKEAEDEADGGTIESKLAQQPTDPNAPPPDLTKNPPPDINDPDKKDYDELYARSVAAYGNDSQLKPQAIDDAVLKAYNLLKDTNQPNVNNTDQAMDYVKTFLGKQDDLTTAKLAVVSDPLICPACQGKVSRLRENPNYFFCEAGHWSDLVLEPDDTPVAQKIAMWNALEAEYKNFFSQGVLKESNYQRGDTVELLDDISSVNGSYPAGTLGVIRMNDRTLSSLGADQAYWVVMPDDQEVIVKENQMRDAGRQVPPDSEPEVDRLNELWKSSKYDKSSPPERISHLPEHEQHKWIAAYNSAHDQGDDEESCNRIAWSNVSDKYKGKKDSSKKEALDENEFNRMMGRSIDHGTEIEITQDGSGYPGQVYKTGDRGFILRKVNGFGSPGNEVYLVDFEHLHGNDWNNAEMYVPESDFEVVDNLEQKWLSSRLKVRKVK